MPQTIWKTAPVPMRNQDPRDGKLYEGLANFSVVLYRVEEPLPQFPEADAAGRIIRPVADWRALFGRPFVVPSQPPFENTIPPQVVPDIVLDSVPPGGRLRFRFRFIPGDNWWEDLLP